MSKYTVSGVRRKSVRERLSERQNHRCCYCGADIREGATIEHFIPLASGGSNAQENLVVACSPCNFKRGSRNAIKFFNRFFKAKYQQAVRQ